MTMLTDSLTPPIDIDWNDPVEVDWDFAQEIGAWGWWPGWADGTKLYDFIGTNHGTLQSSPVGSFGPSGLGIGLRGVANDSYANLGTTFTGESYSLHAWCSLLNYDDYRFLFGDSAQNSKFGINSGTVNQLFVRLRDGGTGQTPTVPAISLNEWHGFGVTKNAGVSAAAYRFGIPTALTADSGSVTFSRLGGENGGTATWCWPGSYCDLLICSKANSSSIMAELAAKPFRLAWQPSRLAIFDLWASGSGTQTITVSAVALASATAQNITLTLGASTITPGTAAASASAIAPTITPGGWSIVVGATALATASAVNATLAATLALTPDVANAIATAESVALAAGAVTLVPDAASATASAIDVDVLSGLAIAVGTALASAAAENVTITPGSSTIACTNVALGTASASDVDILNATLLTLGTALADAIAVDVTATPGVATIVPGVAEGQAASVAVTVVAIASVMPGVASCSATGVSSSIVAATAIVPATATANAAAVDLTIVAGGVALSVGLAIATASAMDAVIYVGVLVAGPFYSLAWQCFVPGSVAGQDWTPSSVAAQSYTPGSKAGQSL